MLTANVSALSLGGSSYKTELDPKLTQLTQLTQAQGEEVDLSPADRDLPAKGLRGRLRRIWTHVLFEHQVLHSLHDELGAGIHHSGKQPAGGRRRGRGGEQG